MAFLRKKSVYCISKEDMDEPHRIAFSAVCLVTASLSAYGACVQLRSWYKQLKDYESRRSPSSNPPVVFSLALADLFACIGVIGMSIIFLTMKYPIYVPDHSTNPNPIQYLQGHNATTVLIPAEKWYWQIGVPVEAFTMFAYIASYFWTLAYSLDICLQVYNKDTWISIWTYQVICWVSPLWLVVWGEYGFLAHTINPRVCSGREQGLLHYLVCYVPLLFVTVTVPIVYFVAFRKIHRNMRGASATYTNTERQILSAIKWKFSFIVIVFMFCWLLNVLDGFDGLDTKNDDFDVHFPVWIVEAIVNPLQGFLNCFVYGQGRELVSCCKGRDPLDLQYMPWAETRENYIRESIYHTSVCIHDSDFKIYL